jgi:hypothetical protein
MPSSQQQTKRRPSVAHLRSESDSFTFSPTSIVQSLWSVLPAPQPPTGDDLTSRFFGTFWPRDLLPLGVRDARVSTFGYHSRWNSALFETSFEESGQQLLTTIDQDEYDGRVSCRMTKGIYSDLTALGNETTYLLCRS